MRIILSTQKAHTGYRQNLCLWGGTDPRPGVITDDWEAIGDK
jgi:predicted aconitase with swiveling domain